MVLPKKLKFIKKEATPKEGLLHRFFVSGYTLTVLATKERFVASVKQVEFILFLCLIHLNNPVQN